MADASTAEQCTAANAEAAKSQGKLSTREAELHVSKECLQQLVFNDGNASKEKSAQLLDMIKLRSQLSSVEAECSSVQQLQDERAAEVAVQHQAAQEAQQVVQESSLSQQQAKEENKDALSNFAVLSSYFEVSWTIHKGAGRRRRGLGRDCIVTHPGQRYAVPRLQDSGGGAEEGAGKPGTVVQRTDDHAGAKRARELGGHSPAYRQQRERPGYSFLYVANKIRLKTRGDKQRVAVFPLALPYTKTLIEYKVFLSTPWTHPPAHLYNLRTSFHFLTCFSLLTCSHFHLHRGPTLTWVGLHFFPACHHLLCSSLSIFPH